MANGAMKTDCAMPGRRRVSTPVRPQFQTTECGVGVLRTMLAYFGGEVSAREVRRISGVSRDCLNAADIRRTARALGLSCDARSMNTSDLKDLKLPVVIHLRFIHFVVLESIEGETVRMNCPNAGIIETSLAEFDEDFTGIVLIMTPSPEFKRTGTFATKERQWWLSTTTEPCGLPPWRVDLGSFAQAELHCSRVPLPG